MKTDLEELDWCFKNLFLTGYPEQVIQYSKTDSLEDIFPLISDYNSNFLGNKWSLNYDSNIIKWSGEGRVIYITRNLDV